MQREQENKTSRTVQFRKEHLHTNMFISSNTFQTLNRTRNVEVTGCEDNASALNSEAHTDEHLELAVQDDHEFTHDIPELDFQDGA